ncbi:FAD/NAD(P)-binding domain-containing protein [Hyaloscypha bicolor E]|uniref:FAD/NAD(P)-binding domain-containing protein n=1 Tax=Hyaloscypha bicolor E TaxID=1095630 RepID=A0A2J6TGZ3_9HELO|nr:FAD/NAD(P)-binding domain-containing protein [Hyaloscypha bicolor E]PMD62287.1 FAD/NAD(P)-binding domain-containing protein [Hyaloscypha bicolor E]
MVVGAGPSGLVLSLLLAQKGVKVTILDAASALDAQPRATHYAAPTVDELRRAGVLDEILSLGFVPNGVAWRKLDGTLLAAMTPESVPEGNRVVCLPLDKMSKIVYARLEKEKGVEVKWGHKVMDIGQDEERAWVKVETTGGPGTLYADYIVGCDGGNSQIRRSLFGNMAFPGRTWDEQIVATNTYYDMSKFNWLDSNFIVDPEHWYMVAKIQTDGLLRITYGDIPGLSREEYIKRQPMKFKQILPGHPEPSEYRLTNISPYKVHQRCAEKFRVGRFLLAADAAHLCNPFGGLGLTGGLVDVGNLYDCLLGIHLGKASPEILDKYDQVRRQKYHEVIDVVSSQNLRLLLEDPDTSEKVDGFVDLCRKANEDKELSRKMQLFSNDIKYDFTKHYDESSSTTTEVHSEPKDGMKVSHRSVVL